MGCTSDDKIFKQSEGAGICGSLNDARAFAG